MQQYKTTLSFVCPEAEAGVRDLGHQFGQHPKIVEDGMVLFNTLSHQQE